MSATLTRDPLLVAADPRVENHELAVIGCCLFEDLADVRGFVLERVADADFMDRNCRLAIKAIRQLVGEGERVNITTLQLALERHGLALDSPFITNLAVDLPDPYRAERYVRALKDARLCRTILDGARKVALKAATGDVEALAEAREMVRVADEQSEAREVRHLAEHVASVVATLDRPIGTAVGIGTGLARLDQLTLGLRPGQFILLAGRPGAGKSALALKFACEAAIRQRKSVAFISLEMSADEQVRRIIAAETGIPHEAIRANHLNANQRDEVKRTAESIKGWDLFIDDTPRLTIGELERRLFSLHRIYGLDLAVIDYIGLVDVDAPGRSREQEVATLSRTCKAMARSLGIPLVALSQLSRKCEERPDKRPMLHDLRESGSLEQDCDLAMFLYRDAMYDQRADPQAAEIIVAKQRDGATGILECRFDGARMRFQP